MVKFTRVKDPERAKNGDIVLFPAGERRLNVSAPTFAKMGLSVGGTSRSDNSCGTVRRWLVRKDMAARAFMLCNASYRSAPSENELLLGMDREDPIASVTLIGLCTDICVISNALLVKAFLPEVPVTVDAACCAGVTPESHRNALAAMKMCQIAVENE